MIEVIAGFLILTGAGFFIAGSIGLLRLPDLCCRLHALTKVDNLGLGLTLIGITLLEGSVVFGLKALLTWLLVMVSGAASAHLIANFDSRQTE